MLRKSTAIVIAAAALVGRAAAAGPPSVQQVRQLVGNPPAGWTVTDGPKVYSPDKLWEWIDGEATDLEEYKLKFAVAAMYSKGGKTAEVGVFVAATPIDAFGLFSRSHGEGAKPAPFVNAGAWCGDQLHVWRGYCYVRVMPVGATPAEKVAVQSIALALCKGIEPAKKLPRLLKLLPQQNLVPCSVVYYRANILGQEKLGNGVKAQYRAGRKTVTLWLIEERTSKAAQAALAVMAGVLGKQRSLPTLGDEAFLGASDAYGVTVAMRKGRYVAAVTNATARSFAEGLLRMLSVRIQIETAAEK